MGGGDATEEPGQCPGGTVVTSHPAWASGGSDRVSYNNSSMGAENGSVLLGKRQMNPSQDGVLIKTKLTTFAGLVLGRQPQLQYSPSQASGGWPPVSAVLSAVLHDSA